MPWAPVAVLVGDEVAEGNVQLRDLLAGTQKAVAVADLARDLTGAEQSPKHG